MTTVEIKYGANVTICTVLLKTLQPTSLRSNASRIGAGKPIASEYRLSITVFFISSQKSGVLKNCLKYLNPNPGTCKYAATYVEIFKGQRYAVHRNIGKDNRMDDGRKYEQVQLPPAQNRGNSMIFYRFACKCL